MKERTINIRGKKFDMKFCDECEVWIQKEEFDNHDCERYQRSKEIRKRVNKKLCG